MALLNERVATGFAGGGTVEFHAGVSYRNLLVWRGGRDDVATTPPHDIIGRAVDEHLPAGAGSGRCAGSWPAPATSSPTARPTRPRPPTSGSGARAGRPRCHRFREVWGLDGAVVAPSTWSRASARSPGSRRSTCPARRRSSTPTTRRRPAWRLDALARARLRLRARRGARRGRAYGRHRGEGQGHRGGRSRDRRAPRRLAASRRPARPARPPHADTRAHARRRSSAVRALARGSERGARGAPRAFGEREAAASG